MATTWFLLLPLNAQAVEFHWIATTYSDGDGHIMPYRLYLPDGYNDPGAHFPLILSLHGSGEIGLDDISQVNHTAGLLYATNSGPYSAFVLMPQLAAGGWGSSNPNDLTMQILDSVINDYEVNTNRLYITGYSLGGQGAFDYLSEHPHTFAAAVPMSGTGDTSPATIDQIKDVPIWMFDGQNDPSVPLMENMDNALSAAGGSPKLTIVPGQGHVIWDPIYFDDQFNKYGLYPWMFSKAIPEPSTFVLAALGFGAVLVGRRRALRARICASAFVLGAACVSPSLAAPAFTEIVDDSQAQFSLWNGSDGNFQTINDATAYGGSYHVVRDWADDASDLGATVTYQLTGLPAGTHPYDAYIWQPNDPADFDWNGNGQWHYLTVYADGTKSFIQNIPWAGQSGTNVQWLNTNLNQPFVGGGWNQLGPGPQSDPSIDGGKAVWLTTFGPGDNAYLQLSELTFYSNPIAIDAIKIVQIDAVPEPSSLVLAGLAVSTMALATWRQRRTRRQADPKLPWAVCGAVVLALVLTRSGSATVLLQDDFETGVSGKIVVNSNANATYSGTWHPWSGPNATGYQQVLITNDAQNHTAGQPGSMGGPPSIGGQGSPGSAWASPYSPYGSSGYADFGAQSGGLHFEAWSYDSDTQPNDSFNREGNGQGDPNNWPVREELGLLGQDTTPPPNPFPAYVRQGPNHPTNLFPYDPNPLCTGTNFTDFVQMGVDPTWAGGQADLSVRTAYMQINHIGTQTSGNTYAFSGGAVPNLQTIHSENPDSTLTDGSWANFSVDTGVSRASIANQWIRFTIDVDSMSAGGQIHMAIWDQKGDQLWSGTSIRTGGVFEYALLGQNLPNYQDYFYDDVLVTAPVPEPASLILFGAGLLVLAGRVAGGPAGRLIQVRR